MLVFVRGLPPLNAEGFSARISGKHRNRALNGTKVGAIEHMYLTAAARLLRMLVKRRLEHYRPEMHPGQLVRTEFVGERFGIDPWCADQLEGLFVPRPSETFVPSKRTVPG